MQGQPGDVDVEASLQITEQAAARLGELGNDLGLARVEYLAGFEVDQDPGSRERPSERKDAT